MVKITVSLASFLYVDLGVNIDIFPNPPTLVQCSIPYKGIKYNWRAGAGKLYFSRYLHVAFLVWPSGSLMISPDSVLD